MNLNQKIFLSVVLLPLAVLIGGCGSLRQTERPDNLISGYRVQLIETDDREAAVDTRNIALLRFAENVYLIFEPPLYKVRVGDFSSREEALQLQDEAIQKGFKRAWVVGVRFDPYDIPSR